MPLLRYQSCCAISCGLCPGPDGSCGITCSLGIFAITLGTIAGSGAIESLDVDFQLAVVVDVEAIASCDFNAIGGCLCGGVVFGGNSDTAVGAGVCLRCTRDGTGCCGVVATSS